MNRYEQVEQALREASANILEDQAKLLREPGYYHQRTTHHEEAVLAARAAMNSPMLIHALCKILALPENVG